MASKRSSNKQKKTIVMVVLFFVLMAGLLFFANYISQKTEQEDSSAMGVKYKTTRGTNISLSRQEVVAKGDRVRFQASFLDTTEADKYIWNWDVCGKKATTTTTTSYVIRTYLMKKVEGCTVKIDGEAYYYPDDIGTEPGDITITPGTVTDAINVLPSEEVKINISGPSSAKVGETFWLESSYNGPTGYSWLNWRWQAQKSACKGSSEWLKPTTKIGESGDKKGTCIKTLTLRVEYPNKVVKGEATKKITIK